MDKTFDLQNPRVKYALGVLIFTRIAQAALITVLRKQTLMSSIIILCLQGLLAVFIAVFRPYRNTFYNLLNVVAEWSVVGFLAVNLVSNLQVIQEQGM